MNRYAIKIGEIHLVSDRPLTREQVKRAADFLRKRGDEPILVLTEGDVTIRLPS